MPKAQAQPAELTHEEIWDDSALIDSWNEALDEYKKYHSIHARGGTLQDLKRTNASKATDISKAPDVDRIDDSPRETERPSLPELAKGDDALSEAQPQPQSAFHAQAILGSMRDDNLKKLLMSWYYAGYYTGLYEGQHQPHPGNQHEH